MTFVIIANGAITRDDIFVPILRRADRIISADGGIRHLRRMNIRPHVVIGDFDSTGQDDMAYIDRHGIEIIRHRTDKDFSDTELASIWAMENGATHLTFIGTTGVRLDHTLSNLFLMKKLARQGIQSRTLDDHNDIYCISDTLSLEASPGDLLSIIPISDPAIGITLRGLDFPLEKATLAMGSSTGVSNRFSGTQAEISLEQGWLLVTLSRDPEDLS